jgi:hypothetical protein
LQWLNRTPCDLNPAGAVDEDACGRISDVTLSKKVPSKWIRRLFDNVSTKNGLIFAEVPRRRVVDVDVVVVGGGSGDQQSAG